MGNWLAVNGESIYATQSTLFGAEAGAFSLTEKDEGGNPRFVPSWKWRSTTASSKIYIHLFEWPDAAFHLDRVSRNVTSAYLLADKARTPLKVTKRGIGLDVELPKQAPDPIASVLVLTTA
jgi:alpha-L-fucosidase